MLSHPKSLTLLLSSVSMNHIMQDIQSLNIFSCALTLFSFRHEAMKDKDYASLFFFLLESLHNISYKRH